MANGSLMILFTHLACLDHDTGPHHPERPARLEAVLDALAGPEFARLLRQEAPQVAREDLLRVHPANHVDSILEAIPNHGLVGIDSDTILSPGFRRGGAFVPLGPSSLPSMRCCPAKAAVPSAPFALPATMRKSVVPWVSASSTRSRSAPAAPLQCTGCRASQIVDFDVHHGNGTQDIFWDDPAVFYVSTQSVGRCTRETGAADERGVANNILNLPLPAGTVGDRFRAVVSPRSAAGPRGFFHRNSSSFPPDSTRTASIRWLDSRLTPRISAG